jgi:hypothetical protein
VKELITLADYWMGRDAQYPEELTDELIQNATTLLYRVNDLLEELHISAKPKIASGWRPLAINAKTPGAAKASNHIIAKAIDIADPGDFLDIQVLCNHQLLDICNLYLENPTATKGWCHLQWVAPKSGKRVFNP